MKIINLASSSIDVKDIQLDAPLTSSVTKYRLLLIGTSNTLYYSHEILVHNTPAKQIQAWPNPARSDIYLNIPFGQSSYTCTIVNTTGQIVYQAKLHVSSVTKAVGIRVADLPKWVYALLISSDCLDRPQSIRFVKE